MQNIEHFKIMASLKGIQKCLNRSSVDIKIPQEKPLSDFSSDFT